MRCILLHRRQRPSQTGSAIPAKDPREKDAGPDRFHAPSGDAKAPKAQGTHASVGRHCAPEAAQEPQQSEQHGGRGDSRDPVLSRVPTQFQDARGSERQQETRACNEGTEPCAEEDQEGPQI